MHVVDDQGNGPKTERITDLMPQPPAVVLRWVKPNYGATGVRCPLLQQRRLAITCGSRDEGDGSRSASAELQKPSTRNNAVLRDFRPSAEGYSLEDGRSFLA